MTITTRDQLVSALGNNSSRFVLDKASIASQTAGTYVSLWRATGQPGQAAIPTTARACTNALTGAMDFAQQTGSETSYGAYMDAACGNSAMTIEIHDRLADMGGLVGNTTSAQTAGVDLNSLSGTSNIAARVGSADYSDVQWWLEWYTATGANAANATVGVTLDDGTTTTVVVALATARPAGYLISLNVAAPAGKYIRAVNSVTLSAATASAGNFGVTASKIRMALGCPLANYKSIANWADLGFPEIKNSACLFPIVLTSTTSSGTVRGGGKLAHG